jgi:hypothetical protein
VGTGHQRHLRPGVLAETTGLDVPIVVLPFVNSTLVGASPSAAAPKASASCPAPADSSPESRRVRTYREQGGGFLTAVIPDKAGG